MSEVDLDFAPVGDRRNVAEDGTGNVGGGGAVVVRTSECGVSDTPPRGLIPYPKTMTLMFLNTVLNLIFASLAAGGEGSQLCVGPPTIPEHACLTPYSYFVIWLTITILLAMVNDIEPDIVLLCATVTLVLTPGPCTNQQVEPGCTIISSDEAWRGFSQPAILAAATLLVFARCLEETRAVELMITPCLKGATNEVSAVARLAFPTFFFSSFLNSTPIVAMLIPVCEAWCAKSGFKLTTVLMPLSFSAMLGGLTSLVGTASNMVLNAQINADDDPPIKEFGFFTQAIAGVPAAMAGLTTLSFLAPILLGRLGPADATGQSGSNGGGSGGGSSGRPTLERDTSVRGSGSMPANMRGTFTAVDEHVQRGYELELLVQPGCVVLNETVLTLQRKVTSDATPYRDIAPTESLSVSVPPPEGGIEPFRVLWVTKKEGTKHTASSRGLQDVHLHTGDKIGVSVAAHVVPFLRSIHGLEAAAEQPSAALANGAKRRCLYEVVLSKNSPLVGSSVSAAAGHKSLVYTVLWAIRRNAVQVAMSVRTYGSMKVSSMRSGRLASGKQGGEKPLQAGDTLLLDADEDFGEKHKNNKGYSLITMVPFSLGPESAATAKPTWLLSLQFYCSHLSLLLMVVVSIMNWMPILPLSFLLAAGLISIGCITPEQAWASIKYRVILTIMAAFGLGDALDNTDVADIIAAALVTVGDVVGPWFFLLIVFSTTAGLSFLVGSTPAIILLYAAVRLTAAVPGITIGHSMMALMLGAVCALATPVGFATNLMVQARAGYVFGDFFLLGSIVTAVIGVVSCSIIVMLPDDLVPEAINANRTNRYVAGSYGHLGDYAYTVEGGMHDVHFANYAL